MTAPERLVDGITILFLILTWITVSARCYVKAVITRSFGSDDYTIVAALILFTTLSQCAIESFANSGGLHLLTVPPSQLPHAFMWFFFTELAYALTTGVVKLSAGLFMLRLVTKKRERYTIYATLSLVFFITIGYFVFLLNQCSPISYFWTQFRGQPGRCISPELIGQFTYIHAAINALTDIIFAVLPVIIVSNLQLNTRKKIVVSSILALGALAAIAVLVRIPYIKVLVENPFDILFYSTNVIVLTILEPGLGITAASLATLRPLFNTFLSRSKVWGTTTLTPLQHGYSYSRSADTYYAGAAESQSRIEKQIGVDSKPKLEKGHARNAIGTAKDKEKGSITTIRSGYSSSSSSKRARGPAGGLQIGVLTEWDVDYEDACKNMSGASTDPDQQQHAVTTPVTAWPRAETAVRGGGLEQGDDH